MKPQLVTVQQGLAEYRLTQDHPLRIANAAGQQIECLDGTAWITAYGLSLIHISEPTRPY